MSYMKDTSSQPIPSIYNNQTSEYKSTFQEKHNIFRNTLFPLPPSSTPVDLNNYQSNPDWKWPKLSSIELKEACTSKIKGKTPGPDLITQEIIVQAYSAIPNIFYIVYSTVTGRQCYAQANGFPKYKKNNLRREAESGL